MYSLFRIGIFCIFMSPFVFSFNHNYPKNRFLNDALKATDNSTAYLLPTNLKPSAYTLILQPFLNNASFNGWVTIMFDVINSTDSIVLNMDNSFLTITSCKLTTGQSVDIINTITDAVHTQVTFGLNGTLSKETGVVISIAFSGTLGSEMLGFYLSTYSTTTQHAMAITQFEPNFARRAFPCFDEPAYRATFNISILRLPTQNSLANMPLLKSGNSDTLGWVIDTYETSPSMPTYLVAFGVSDLPNITNGTFRLFAREAAIGEGAYLLSVGQTILDVIGNFTQISYPLPKMDVVAVPDFDAGAMENWGLCTYREKYVLFNSTLNTWRSKFDVLSVNAHEFGHQWFGDLVTPALWNYAWLNEAFATYFEYTTSNTIEPDWNVGSTEYVISAVQVALDSDVGSPRAMTSPVYSTKQIENSFDYVIYEKGGSILRMTEHFLTTDVWRAGLNIYLTNNSFKTGTPEKLFSALQEAASTFKTGLDNVQETLKGWTEQPGYPLITVINSNHNITNSTTGQYKITQTPYAFNDNTTTYKWNVPLVYTTELDREFNASRAMLHWLNSDESSTSTLTVNTSGWVIFNVDQVGFYRVNYDDDNWIKIKAQLDSDMTAISAVNRAQLVDDALHLARTGDLKYSTALSLVEFLVNETHPEAWNAFFTNVKFLLNQFYGTTTGDGLKSWAQELMSYQFSNMSDNLLSAVSTYQSSLSLLLVSQFACDIELPECEAFAQQAFEKWRSNSLDKTVPEITQMVICTGLRLDPTREAFLDVWNYFLASKNGIEQLMLINTLGCLTKQTIINEYLDAVCNVSANNVRLQDRWISFRSLLSRQSGVMFGLEYISQNYASVKNALGRDFTNVFSYMASTISQEDDVTTLKNLINNSGVDKELRQSLNSTVLPAVEKRATWVQSSQAQALIAWVSALTSSALSHAENIVLIITAFAFIKLSWDV